MATDPAGTADEISGLIRQVLPRVIVTDAAVRTLVVAACGQLAVEVVDLDAELGDWTNESAVATFPWNGSVTADDLAVLIPTSGTTGRSKLVMQTHRAYAMAAVGFPYWMELTAEDRLMTSLPLFHINAPAYSVLGSLAAGAGLVLVPRFSASGFLDSARRHRATEFNAIGAMLEILMRQPVRPDDAETDLRLCYTGPSPTREWQEAFEERFGLRVVCGYAMSESPYGLIWRHGERPFGTLGSTRQHPTLGTVNEARVVDDEGRTSRPERSVSCCCATRSSRRATGGCRSRPRRRSSAAGCTPATSSPRTPTATTHSSRAEGGAAPARPEPLTDRGRGGDRGASRVLEVAVVAVPSELTEDEVKAFVVAAPGRRLDFEQLRAWTAARLSAFKVPRFWQALDALPRTPTSRVAKHRLPWATQRRVRRPARRFRTRPQGRAMTSYPTSIGPPTKRRSTCSATTSPRTCSATSGSPS